MRNKNPTANIKQVADTNRFNKRIGSVVYEVSVNFKSNATETLDSKIARLIKNDLRSVS